MSDFGFVTEFRLKNPERETDDIRVIQEFCKKENLPFPSLDMNSIDFAICLYAVVAAMIRKTEVAPK